MRRCRGQTPSIKGQLQQAQMSGHIQACLLSAGQGNRRKVGQFCPQIRLNLWRNKVIPPAPTDFRHFIRIEELHLHGQSA
jgi:hypothetical protein